jgi:S-DNA-T family DNA segregation ATPase FtsK/SpoIIIE
VLIPIVFFLGYKIVFRRAAGSVSYVLALGLFTMLWTSTLLGYVVVQMALPSATQPVPDPVQAHRLDWLSGSVGFEMAYWLDSLIGWGTVLLLAFGLIMFVVFFFNVTSLNLGLGGRDEDEEVEDAADMEAAPVRPAPAAANSARPAAKAAPVRAAEVEPAPAPAREPEYEPAPAPRPSTLKAPVPLTTNLEVVEEIDDEPEVEPLPSPLLGGVGAALPLAVVSTIGTVPAAAATAAVASSAGGG